MVSILINKDVFEPSYNDLKFKVQNCNYFCTNLNITQLEALKKTLQYLSFLIVEKTGIQMWVLFWGSLSF